MRVLTLISVVGVLLTAGCASNAPIASTPTDTATPSHHLQTRVAWLPSCPHQTSPTADAKARIAFLGLIAAAIAPKVVEGAVDSAAAALKAAGEAKTSASTATNLSNFYGVTQNADLKVLNTCLTVIRGQFSSNVNRSIAAWADNDQLRGLTSVQFMLEAKVKPLRGNKYFQLVPQYLEVSEFEDHSLVDRKDRDYTVAVSMSIPGGAQPFGSAELTFKDIGVGTISDPNDWRLRGATSMPIAFPTESADATKAKAKREAQMAPYLLAIDILSPEAPELSIVPSLYSPAATYAADLLCKAIDTFNHGRPKQFQVSDDRCSYKLEAQKAALDAELKKANRSPMRTAWARSICKTPTTEGSQITGCRELQDDIHLDSPFTHFTTQLTLSETREGSKFAAFLAAALGAAKADVANVIKEKVLPKTQAQREAESDERTAVLLSDLEVTKAEEVLAATLLVEPTKPADITAARIALLKAKIDCNKAYRKANLPVRFTELI